MSAPPSPLLADPFKTLADPSRLFGMTVDSVEVLQANERRVVVDIMRLFLSIRIPIYIWGPVGARKTRTVEALSREKDPNGVNFQVITVMPSTSDPTTIHGLYYVAQENGGEMVMKRSIPEIAKQVVAYHEQTGGYTIMFMDEMTTCMPAQQNAMLGLLTHGKFEGIDISPYVTFALAANPEGTVSTVNPLGEAIMNRGGHIPWYGDLNMFLDDWSSGFHGAVARPSSQTEWYIRTMLEEHPEKAFRNSRWTPQELVPWDLMEHTERAVTELARLIELVNDVFSSRPDAIRRFYLVEVTKAMLGRDWAGYMSDVVNKESTTIHPSSVIERVRQSGIELSSSLDDIRSKLGRSLVVDPAGNPVSSDSLNSLFHSLVKETFREGFRRDVYITAWALVVSVDDDSDVAGLGPESLRALVESGRDAYDISLLESDEVIPKMVEGSRRETVALLLKGNDH